jgi:hypothetical protein
VLNRSCCDPIHRVNDKDVSMFASATGWCRFNVDGEVLGFQNCCGSNFDVGCFYTSPGQSLLLVTVAMTTEHRMFLRHLHR